MNGTFLDDLGVESVLVVIADEDLDVGVATFQTLARTSPSSAGAGRCKG